MIKVASFVELFRRLPKGVLFATAGLVQVAVLAMMVIDRAEILRDGREVVLHVAPVDPRDLLRGDYVVLSYVISNVPAGELEGKPVSNDGVVYVKLRPDPDGGFYRASSVHINAVPVTPPEVLLRGRSVHSDYCGGFYCSTLRIKYNLESYFVPEGEGLKLERIGTGRLTVVAAVLPSGRAAIKRLLVDGKPVYDEPWF